MYGPISICVPAFNEEKTISNTLESLVGQTFPGKTEILICANGCTDRTGEIATQMSVKYNNITVISTPQKGKPNAWNILRRKASSNYIFFADADVVFSGDAIQILYDTLQTEGVIAATVPLVPVMDNRTFLTRVMAPPPGNPGCLVGALYGFANDRLEERMHSCGFYKMPEDIICEDSWLTLVVGKGNWKAVPGAKVYF